MHINIFIAMQLIRDHELHDRFYHTQRLIPITYEVYHRLCYFLYRNMILKQSVLLC